jgi:hypothetical protein
VVATITEQAAEFTPTETATPTETPTVAMTPTIASDLTATLPGVVPTVPVCATIRPMSVM